jgi:hypothetical protein
MPSIRDKLFAVGENKKWQADNWVLSLKELVSKQSETSP